MGLSRARVVLPVVLVGLALPGVGRAAEMTRVATAFELKNPFDLDMNVGFALTTRSGRINRENHQPDADTGEMHVADVIELKYSESVQEMPISLAIGLFEDFELHVGTSMVFGHNRSWDYADKDDDGKPLDPNNSSLRTCLDSRNIPIPGCTPDTAQPFLAMGKSYRAGLGNLTFGVKWAALSDAKDDTKPKWVLGFDWTAPTASMADPAEMTTSSSKGAVGDKVNRLLFSTALSKRVGAIDPYVKLAYSLPIINTGAYSNCSNSGNLGFYENCGAKESPWTHFATGVKPSHVGTLVFGAEFNAYDRPMKGQKVGFDLQLSGSYISEGRGYNELSDALGKLLYNEEYLRVGGSLGVYARAAEYVQFKLNASIFHETEHFLTNEQVGQDLDDSCKGVAGEQCVDLDNHSAEINPNFDFRYDMPGRRFRISNVAVYSVMATGEINF